MAEVANKILGVNHAAALEMALSEDPAAAYEKTKQLVIERNQGRGCILLADMGSLLTFAEKIRQETKIPVAVCGRVDTLMVIECLHKVLWTEESIETIVDELDSKKTLQPKTAKYNKIQHKRAVLCLCITGQGAAKLLRDFISERLKSVLDNIVIINRGYIENEDVEQIILQEAAQYEILAIVGTINPEVKNIPFLSLDDIYQSSGISKLRKIIKNSLLLDHEGAMSLVFGLLLAGAETVTVFTTFELFYQKMQMNKFHLECPEIPDEDYPHGKLPKGV